MKDERFQRALRENAEAHIRASGDEGLRLHGGPLDAWWVAKASPCLSSDWYRSWPPSHARDHRPGRYVPSDDGTSATWTEYAPGETPGEY